MDATDRDGADAEEGRVRLMLANVLVLEAERQGLGDADAARACGIPAEDFAKLRDGLCTPPTLSVLFKGLARMGRDVEIVVSSLAHSSRGRLLVHNRLGAISLPPTMPDPAADGPPAP